MGEDDRARPGAPADARPTDARGVVHVVDDDPALRESIVFLLSTVGIEALTYPDPATFLAELDPAEPGVVLLDVRMPGLSGFDVQDRLVELDYPGPIVFCSAHGDVPQAVRAMRAGAVEFLEKPSDPQRLIEVVQGQLAIADERFADAATRRGLAERLDRLTPGERRVLRLAVQDRPTRDIADELGVSVKTVDVHRARIKAKTGATSVASLVHDIVRARLEV